MAALSGVLVNRSVSCWMYFYRGNLLLIRGFIDDSMTDIVLASLWSSINTRNKNDIQPPILMKHRSEATRSYDWDWEYASTIPIRMHFLDTQHDNVWTTRVNSEIGSPTSKLIHQFSEHNEPLLR